MTSSTKYKKKIFISLYGILFVFLVFSEYFNAFFNTKYDSMNISLHGRLLLAFKPMVMILYVVFTTIIYSRIIKFLKPLFDYLENGSSYDKARIAAIRIPWMIINFQVFVWALGTTAYYVLRGWVAESGIPFFYGITLKSASGFLSALYVAFAINLILKDAKLKLCITNIRTGENDNFSRHKDIVAIIASSIYLIINFSYVAFYFASEPEIVSNVKFLLMTIPMGLILLAIGIYPIYLSKKEYYFQIKTIMKELRVLSSKDSDDGRKIYLINFDELGEMAAYINVILDKFNGLISNISGVVNQLVEASVSLASVSEQSSSVSNQQAAAVAEIVSTMDDSNSLSKTIGNKSVLVLEKASKMKNYVDKGDHVIEEHLKTSDMVKSANENTIEFIVTLNDDIKIICNIVSIINNIADQVKIIAYNAELEASAAGDAGKNFEIVASEIRRLADNTVASTTEIKNKIDLIEKAGHGLMNASKTATLLIETSWEISKRAKDIFQRILKSSDDATVYTKGIEEKIRMQIQGFEQIFLAMKQISESTSDFTASTSVSSRTTVELSEIVESLKKLIIAKK